MPTTLQRIRHCPDRGTVTVELAGFVLPAMLAVIVISAGLFNLSVSRLDLEFTAAAAARAASLQRTPTAASSAALAAAGTDLAARAITCNSLSVATDVSRWRRGGSVTVTIACTVSMQRLAGITGIPGRYTKTATSTAPIDAYRRITT
jgi:Flp pilus assembly protein TadG